MNTNFCGIEIASLLIALGINQLQINNSILLKHHEDNLGLEKNEIVASSEYKDDVNGRFFNKEGSVSMNVAAPIGYVIENEGSIGSNIDFDDENERHDAIEEEIEDENVFTIVTGATLGIGAETTRV